MTLTACQELHTLEEFTFFPGRPRIVPDSDGVIWWHIDDYHPDHDQGVQYNALLIAFDMWREAFFPIELKPTSDFRKANIRVFFASDSDPNDLPPIPFGEASTLAYAFAPVNNRSEIWMDRTENWNFIESSAGAINAKIVLAHECGHSFGLGHTEAPGDLMEAFYNPVGVISTDSVAAIKELYGDLQKEFEANPKPDPTPIPPVPVPPIPRPTNVNMDPKYFTKGIPTPSLNLALRRAIRRPNVPEINRILAASLGSRKLVDVDIYGVRTPDSYLERRYKLKRPQPLSAQLDQETRFLNELSKLRDEPLEGLRGQLPDEYTQVSWFLDDEEFWAWDYQAGEDFLTTDDEWFGIQRGETHARNLTFSKKVPVTTGRLAASYVHSDHWTRPFEKAAIRMLELGIPTRLPRRIRQSASARFAGVGAPFISGLLGEVVMRAGIISFRGKWSEMCPRPEEYARKHLGFLLSQCYPEGSPMHPSCGQMHGAAAEANAGALITLFDETAVLPSGRTVYDELELMAANIGAWRDWAGVHYPSDRHAIKDRFRALGQRVVLQRVR